jgi:AAA family ATP:ADP antiporter
VPPAPGSPSPQSTTQAAAHAEAAAQADAAAPAESGTRLALFGDNPLLLRIAGLVVLSTAAALVVDYLFKSTVAHVVAPARLGSFFARYYAVTNGIALVVQLVITGRLVRRIGVVGAVGVMPFLLLTGGIGALLASGTFYLVLGLKAVDGSMRHSLNRVSTELLYLPLPSGARERGKGFVDSVLCRVVQATTAVVLYFLAMRDLATPRILAFIVVALSVAWLALAATLRRTYLDLFRHALARGGLDPGANVELDFASAEAIVESMASPDPNTVVGAMDVLDLHGRSKLIPALVLYHEADAVLVHALGLFGASKRTDWIPLGERLLNHPREVVRIAAVRALARRGRVEAIRKATDDISSKVQGYAAFHIANGEALADLLEHPLIMVIMRMPGEIGHASRAGLLAAISDSPDARAAPLLLAFAARAEIREDGDTMAQVAAAAARTGDPQFIPIFIARLAQRPGRGAIRDALVAIGEPALDALDEALRDPETPRAVRLHVPRTIACFASQRACDVLLARLTDEKSGFVRYKIVRSLAQLVAGHKLKADRAQVEKEVRHNLEEHLRLLAQRTALASPGPEPADAEAAQAAALLFGLLDDKLLQSSERAFRLLEIAHPHEDIHRVYTATLSRDVRARANAGEFLDALLARRDQQPLRELLRVVLDDASDRARVAHGAALVPGLVHERDEAIAALVDDHDDALAALAAYHALSLGGPKLHAAVHRARETRPSLLALGDRFLAALALAQDPSRA